MVRVKVEVKVYAELRIMVVLSVIDEARVKGGVPVEIGIRVNERRELV